MPSSLQHILQRLAHSLLQLCETDTNIIPILQLRKRRLDEVWKPVRGRQARIPKVSGLDSNISFLSLLFLSCSGLSPTFLDHVQITHALRTACPLPGCPLSIFHCSICLALRFYSSSQILEFSNGLETSLK